MKTPLKFNLLVLLLLIFSCNQKTTESKNNPTQEAHPSKIIKIAPKPTVSTDDLSKFDQLCPIALQNPQSKNVYKKYGIELAGNCYDCDLAEISIDKKQFLISNVCDQNDNYAIAKFSYQLNPKQLTIKTEQNEFIFTMIDTAPIYQLKITGAQVSLKNKRIAKFYTLKKVLPLFEQHDCGDFQG